MLELKTLSGSIIDLVNTEATIELSNSLFNDGSKFTGSYSYPIDIAFTGPNKLLLGYANAIETGVKATNMPVYAKIGGKSFRKCILKTSISEKSFEGNLEIDLGTLNTLISSTKINQVNFTNYSLGKTVSEISASMQAAAVNTNWRNIPYTFFPVRNPLFTGQAYAAAPEVPEWSGNNDEPVKVNNPIAIQSTLINSIRIENGKTIFEVQSSTASQAKWHTTPFFYLPYVLSEIAGHLGLVLKGDFIQHADVEKIVIYNVNDTFISRDSDISSITQEKEGLSFKADDHLPDISISEFFKILAAYFCVRITPDIGAGELNISWKKSVFNKPVFKDWSKKLVKIKKQDFEISDGYTLTAQVDKLDTDKEQPVESVTVGAGKDKVEIKAGALRLVTEGMPGTENIWKIPFDNRVGNIVDPIFRELENFKPFGGFTEFPLRFMMTKGMSTYDVNPVSYPMGTVDGIDFSLNLESVNKFAIQPWFARTYAAKKAQVNFLLTAGDICELKDSDIILFKAANGTTIQALFEKLTFTSKRENKVLAEADLIILDSSAIREANNSGVYVKIAETNLQNTFYLNSDYQPLLPARVVLSTRNISTIDLSVSLFSDKNCLVPIENPNVYIYLSVLTNDSRINVYTNLNNNGNLNTTYNQEYEGLKYRKIFFNTHKITLFNQVKSSNHTYKIFTNDSAKSAFIIIKRKMTFKTAENGDYIIAK